MLNVKKQQRLITIEHPIKYPGRSLDVVWCKAFHFILLQK